MANHANIELSNITLAEIEAGVQRGRELRSRYYHDLGRRLIAALRRAIHPAHPPIHGAPLAHGC